MSKFKDAQGREWKLRITIGTIRKVKDDTDINIGAFLDDDLKIAKKVLTDPLTTFIVLWSLCEDQAAERKISSDDFGELLLGDVLEDARQAIWSAFLDFCPSQQREILQTLMAKNNEVQELMLNELINLDSNDLISYAKAMNVRASAG